jgi:steroid delta-isomerase
MKMRKNEEHTMSISAEHIRATIQRYFDSFAAGDLEAIVELFAADAFIEDPFGAPRIQGHAALRAFYRAGQQQTGGISMKAEGAVRIAGNTGACAALGYCENAQPPFYFETLDVMTFDAAVKIASMLAYWGPDNHHPLRGE